MRPASRSSGPRCSWSRPTRPGVRSHDRPIRTGPGGTFHFEQLDPDDTVSLRARTEEATTDGAVVVRPKDVKGKLTLTIDSAHTFRIRGLVTDQSGQTDRGGQGDACGGTGHTSARSRTRARESAASSRRTRPARTAGSYSGTSGRATEYSIVIEARGHARVETPELTGKAGRDP